MKKTRIWRLLFCLLLTTAAVLKPVAASGQSAEEEIMVMQSVGYGSSFPSAVGDAEVELSAIPADTGIGATDLRELWLTPGGMPFGVKFLTEGVSVVGFCDVEKDGVRVNPAATAGLKLKDTILRVNGEPLSGAAQLTEAIENCGGKEMVLLCRRDKKEIEIRLTPIYCKSEARYKTGIWVRDSGAGIGTVTFLLPETGAFAGLGHGICDADTGALVAMRRGTVCDVTVSSVVRGKPGTPGELKGYFNTGKVGALLGNSACGVWGVFSELPEPVSEPMQVGLRDEVKEGDAYLLCTLDSNQITRYDVRITNINREATGSKCFTVKVTDPDLLAASGGIVQGMSGSPIIQNGKLIGAVTHVLVNDPTVGYGIYLENMLVTMPLTVR